MGFSAVREGIQPNVFFSLMVPRRGVDKNSLWAVLTPAGLRRVAPCPNSAVGSVCEPRNGSSPGWDLVRLEGGYCRSLSLVLMVPRRRTDRKVKSLFYAVYRGIAT